MPLEVKINLSCNSDPRYKISTSNRDMLPKIHLNIKQFYANSCTKYMQMPSYTWIPRNKYTMSMQIMKKLLIPDKQTDSVPVTMLTPEAQIYMLN